MAERFRAVAGTRARVVRRSGAFKTRLCIRAGGIAALALALAVLIASCKNEAQTGRDASVAGRDAAVAVAVAAESPTSVTNSSNFNGTAIAAGRTIWFTSIFKITGVGAQPVHVHMRASHITFSANGTTYDLPTPDGHVTIDPGRTTAVTTFDSNTQSWSTLLPQTWSGNAYLTGFAYTVPANLPGGINPVAWSASFDADASGLTVKWAWSAAVYTTFGTSYNALNVKPVDDNAISDYHNSDHAGTPEAFKTNVVGGARGGGGSNYTGSLSGTLNVAPSPCSPTGGTDTTCNGVDDDCDALIDDDFVSSATSCGQGVCARTGTTSCVSGALQNSCTPGAATGTDNNCDAVDQDCDGLIDEAYPATTSSCGIGACMRTGATSCVTGNVQNNCTPGTPAANDATCNAVDDDCSGVADEDYLSLVTSCGVGACVRAGNTSCVAGGVVDSCAPGGPAPNDATCDGIDDDCSGVADEDYVSLATSCGMGACAATGTTSCAAGAVHDSCTAGTAATNDATCDGIDGDCSGSADEDYAPQPTQCGVGACASTGVTSCSAGTVHDSCATGTPEPDDSCDLIDQDCDGEIDEGCESDCTDTIDNDDDGDADCDDSDCHEVAECAIGRACTADSDCTALTASATHGKCLFLFPGGYCTRDCVPEADPSTCPGGSFCSAATSTCALNCDGNDDCADQHLECSDLESLSDPALLCRPTCETGTCHSGMYCDPSDNLCFACTTTDTSCDRVDQDCDGNVDDDVPPQPTSCGVGACVRSGARTCVNGQMHDSCSPGTPAATDTTCNGVDDNCNGSADEGYLPLATNCGIGACARTGVTSCLNGVVHDSCAAGAPAADDATCDGLDDDCSGTADEDYVSVTANCGVGACVRTGMTSCFAGSIQTNCTPGSAAPSDTTCDGVDDNCNGTKDEGYVSVPTSCGTGACARTGATSCVGGSVQNSCTPGTPAATDTTCDGIDDNCSGVADEGFAPSCSGTIVTTCSNAHTVSTECSDANACNGVETCSNGACQAGAPVVIDDNNPCTFDSCDPATGVSHTAVTPGFNCSDGNVCNGVETCQVFSSSPNCVALPSNAVAWWPGDDNTNEIVGGMNGSAVGGLTFTQGNVAHGFSFDGVDDAVDVSAWASALNSTGPTTIEMWILVPEDTCRTIFHLRQDATHEQLLQVGNGCSSVFNNELITWTYVNGSSTTLAGFLTGNARSQLIGGTQRHHLALSFDGVNTRMWIDRVEKFPSQVGTNKGVWGNFQNPTVALIGAQQSSLVGAPFKGMIDELTIYNRALSQTEITGIFNANTAGKCKPSSSTPVCTPGTPLATNDGNPCTIDSCDPSTGVSHVSAAPGTACNDSSVCTQGDACNAAGSCVGTPVNVDDGNACTDDSCSLTLGVTHQAVVVNDNNDCTNDSCDPSTGVHHTPVSVGTACTDHDGCTTGDVCNASGACHGTAVETSDGNACTNDLCNSADGVTYTISHFPSGNGSSCSDGNVCTDPDFCRTVPASCTSQPSGAVALWPADGYATDVIGAKHGVLGGGASYGSGFIQAFAFNGTDAFVNVDASAQAMNVSAPATIEFWARPTTDTCNTVFHLRQDATHEQKLQIGNGCTSSLTNEWVTWTYVNGAVTSTVGYTPPSHPVFSTLHYALTFNGTSTTIYVDGVQVATTVGSGTGQGKWGGFSGPLNATLGAVRTSGVASTSFNGTIDDLAVYNRVLSASEIAAIKSAGAKCWLPLCDSGDPISNIDDGDTCTVDSCDPVTGIHHAPAVGVSCDDGNRCTAGDACNAQSLCSGHPADFCANIGRACTQDSDCGADAPGGICFTEAETGIPGGMCSVACTATLACPSTTKCNGLLMHAPVVRNGVTINSACFPKCTTNANCTNANATCDLQQEVCTVNCTSNALCASGHYCVSPFCLPAQSHETNCADGLDEDADGATDCADTECFGNPNCGENCTNNIDDDADGLADCHDSECPHQCEICYSDQPGYVAGVDDDHDGLADCHDPDCQAIGTLCQEGAGFHCSDNVDNDLDGKVDCEDTDCLGFGDCQECPLCNGHCSDGKDNDADGLADCQDPDCGTLAACAENTTARCSDGLDNDADGHIDCTDPDCGEQNGVTLCTEGGTHNLNCGDHIDNDHDGLVDCLDPSCACFERCDDNIDNDGNGAKDCADFRCLGDPACVENCSDGIDNNHNSLIDCMDPNCDGHPECVETDCADGQDNEHDGRTDCSDADCTDSPDCPETCDNGIDDDGNHRADCADPECADRDACREDRHCDDGLDNDRDNVADCYDPDCAGHPACDEATHCRDGLDNDADGELDCADSECAGAAPCIPEICGNMVDDDGDGMFDCADADCNAFVACDDPPPLLSVVAPENNPSLPTTLFDSMAFVYSGPSPIQYFVAPETIVRERAALVRGQVRARGGAPMPGVTITILHHAEFGETKTDVEGMFTMVVNGGADLVVNYELNGFIPVQRQVHTTWNEYAFAEDVVMTAYDTAVTSIDLSGSAAIQVARGNVVTDDAGSRQITILVPANVGAAMVFADGTTTPMPTASIRGTEFTFGSEGLDGMPAALPSGTAYTYAVEFTADEALAAGADSVQFSAPIYAYLENFLGAGVGSAMPSAFYDRRRAAWITTTNGRVIKVLQTGGGVAALDVRGTGDPSSQAELDALGITQAELVEIATLYSAGQELWRVPIEHFSPRDFNAPYGPPDDAEGPPANGGDQIAGRTPTSKDGTKLNCEETRAGSIIGCYSRGLGEDVPIPGTPYSLHYESIKSQGPAPARSSFKVTMHGTPSMDHARLRIYMFGRRFEKNFPLGGGVSLPSEYTFEFDGKDAAGREVFGSQEAQVELCNIYPSVRYNSPSSIDNALGAVRGRLQAQGLEEQTRYQASANPGPYEMCRHWKEIVSLSPGTNIGSWDIDVHQTYDPVLHRVYSGDGSRQGLGMYSGATSRVAGNGLPCTTHNSLGACGISDAWSDGEHNLVVENPFDVAIGPDGALYIMDYGVTMLAPDGRSRHVIGRFPTTLGDDLSFFTPASRFQLGSTRDIELGPDGKMYIYMQKGPCSSVYRFGIDTGSVELFAGSVDGSCGSLSSAEGIPATQARLGEPRGMKFAPDGALYLAEPNRVRRIGTNGIIRTLAGTSTIDAGADPDHASIGRYGVHSDSPTAALDMAFGDKIMDIAVHRDGELLIATGSSVFAVGLDGVIQAVAKGASHTSNPDINDPFQAVLSFERIATDAFGGVLLLNRSLTPKVWMLHNGSVVQIAGGDADSSPYVEGRPASSALKSPQWIGVHPDGRVLVADSGHRRILSLTPKPMTSASLRAGLIPSNDGSVIWQFDKQGRHARTLDGLTRAVLYRFGYDDNGLLVGVQDADGNLTKIERDSVGRPFRIVPPFAAPTELTLDNVRRLQELDGPGGHYQFDYKPGTRLLSLMTDPTSATSTFEYDEDELRLKIDADAAGGVQRLTRQEDALGFNVIHTTSDTANPTIYSEIQSLEGAVHRIVEQPDGSTTTSHFNPDGTQTQQLADGTTITVSQGPDPRYGMNTPVTESATITLPSGLQRTDTEKRSITLQDPFDPFSIQQLRIEQRTGTDPAAVTTYDAMNRTLHTVSPEGREAIVTLDSEGRIVKTELPSLESSTIKYDAVGRIKNVAIGAGSNSRRTTFDYRADGYLGTVTGPVEDEQSVLTPDGVGRVTDAQRPDAEHIQMSYDAVGRLRTVTPPGRPQHAMSYTPIGLPAEYHAPGLSSGSQLMFHADYNRDRKLDLVTRADGRTLDYQYDPQNGRLTRLQATSASYDYTYKTSGELGSVLRTDAQGAHTLTFDYDGSLPTLEAWSGNTGLIGGSVERVYDDHFRVDKLKLNDAVIVDYDYDRDNLLSSAGPMTIARRHDNGILSGTTLGQLTTTQSVTTFGELDDFAASYDGNLLYNEHVTERDKLGRIVHCNDTASEGGAMHVRSYEYLYDHASRLADVFVGGDQVSHYDYDPNGNRIGFVSATAHVIGHYDNQDRLTRYCPEDASGNMLPMPGAACFTYTYRTTGELSTRTDQLLGQTTHYDYDELGALRSVQLGDGRTIEYEIDAAGRRVGKYVDGVKQWGLLYQSGLAPIAQLDADSNVTSVFVYGTRPSVPDYMIRQGVVYRFVADHLGSVRMVVNTTTGEVVEQAQYDEFGNVLADSAPGFHPFGFAGGLYDADTGLVRFGARDYDAVTGRWTAKDRLIFGGGSANLYSYVGNNPINLIDVTGLRPLSASEAGFVQYYFGASFDTSNIDVGESISPEDRAWQPYGDRISLPSRDFMGKDSANGIDLGNPQAAAEFAHEALHVWQRRHGTPVTWRGACLQIPYSFGGANPYAVPRTNNPNAKLRQFLYGNIEQQGQIFQDFVYTDLTGGNVAPYALVRDLVNPP